MSQCLVFHAQHFGFSDSNEPTSLDPHCRLLSFSNLGARSNVSPALLATFRVHAVNNWMYFRAAVDGFFILITDCDPGS